MNIPRELQTDALARPTCVANKLPKGSIHCLKFEKRWTGCLETGVWSETDMVERNRKGRRALGI